MRIQGLRGCIQGTEPSFDLLSSELPDRTDGVGGRGSGRGRQLWRLHGEDDEHDGGDDQRQRGQADVRHQSLPQAAHPAGEGLSVCPQEMLLQRRHDAFLDDGVFCGQLHLRSPQTPSHVLLDLPVQVAEGVGGKVHRFPVDFGPNFVKKRVDDVVRVVRFGAQVGVEVSEYPVDAEPDVLLVLLRLQ